MPAHLQFSIHPFLGVHTVSQFLHKMLMLFQTKWASFFLHFGSASLGTIGTIPAFTISLYYVSVSQDFTVLEARTLISINFYVHIARAYFFHMPSFWDIHLVSFYMHSRTLVWFAFWQSSCHVLHCGILVVSSSACILGHWSCKLSYGL